MGERSFCEWQCKQSFAYLEILMQALVILIVATELSREHVNEGVYGTRIDPRARGGFTKALLGIWQGQDVWADMIRPPGVSSTFAAIHSRSQDKSITLAFFGGLSVVLGTAILYLSFFIFIESNRKWQPALFDVPDLETKNLQDTTNKLIWIGLGLQGYFSMLLITSHFGWLETPIFSTLFLTIIWFEVSYVCSHLSGDGLQILRDFGVLKHDWDVFKANAKLSKSRMVSAVLCLLWILWLGVQQILLFLVISILAAIPLVPVVVWSGMIRLTIVLFGAQAAFPAQIVLTVLLITYANGRLMGLWMTGSNLEWIIFLIQLARCKPADFNGPFPFVPVKIKLPKNYHYQREIVTGLFLDCMAICVVSCPLWAAYAIGTNLENCNYRPAFLVRTFFGNRMLPTILAPITAKISYWSNITCSSEAHVKCREFQSVPGESIMGTVGMVVSGVLAHATLLTLILALFLVFVFSIASSIKKSRSTLRDEKVRKPGTKQTSWDKSAWTARLHDCHSAMALVPQYIVKVALPVYALDLFLPENTFLPGITVWLVGSGVCFYCKLIFEILAFICNCDGTASKATLDSECQERGQQEQITAEKGIKLSSTALI